MTEKTYEPGALLEHFKGGRYKILYDVTVVARAPNDASAVLFKALHADSMKDEPIVLIVYLEKGSFYAFDEREVGDVLYAAKAYLSLDHGTYWVRRSSEFSEEVTWPNGTKKPRFIHRTGEQDPTDGMIAREDARMEFVGKLLQRMDRGSLSPSEVVEQAFIAGWEAGEKYGKSNR